LLRDFSAPVILEYDYSDSDYAFLMAYDDNAFNRWAAAQALASNTIINLVKQADTSTAIIIDAFKTLLADKNLEPALKAEALSLPSLSDIQEAWLNQHHDMNPVALFKAKESLKHHIAQALQADFINLYQSMNKASGLSDEAMQQRKLQNVCLSYLVSLGGDMLDLAYTQFETADNMTNQYAALAALGNQDGSQREQALKAFAAQWMDESNVMDKWFGVQASSSLPNTLSHVKTLMQHPKFSMKNPNKVRALIGGFAMRNPLNFHAVDGSGYQFIAERVLELDKLNPQIAARMVRALMDWERLEPTRQSLMKVELERIANSKGLSGDVAEIANKSLHVNEEDSQ
jgi:aminopeptidase N